MKKNIRKYVPVSGQRGIVSSVFTVTFDEYNDVDTIEQDGKILASNNKYAKAILRGADKMLHGIAPIGFTWA